MRPLDLLYKDRSLLSVEQWSLLSNVIHCYDIHSPIQEIQLSMAAYPTVPPKSRLKIAANNLMITMNLFFSSVWSFVEAVPHYGTLSLSVRQNLMRRNVHQMGALSGAHVCQEGRFHDDPTNQSVGLAEYGFSQMALLLEAIRLGISDRTISRLFLLVMCFSTASDIVQLNIDNTLSWTGKFLFHQQELISHQSFINNYKNYVQSITYADLLYSFFRSMPFSSYGSYIPYTEYIC